MFSEAMWTNYMRGPAREHTAIVPLITPGYLPMNHIAGVRCHPQPKYLPCRTPCKVCHTTIWCFETSICQMLRQCASGSQACIMLATVLFDCRKPNCCKLLSCDVLQYRSAILQLYLASEQRQSGLFHDTGSFQAQVYTQHKIPY